MSRSSDPDGFSTRFRTDRWCGSPNEIPNPCRHLESPYIAVRPVMPDAVLCGLSRANDSAAVRLVPPDSGQWRRVLRRSSGNLMGRRQHRRQVGRAAARRRAWSDGGEQPVEPVARARMVVDRYRRLRRRGELKLGDPFVWTAADRGSATSAQNEPGGARPAAERWASCPDGSTPPTTAASTPSPCRRSPTGTAAWRWDEVRTIALRFVTARHTVTSTCRRADRPAPAPLRPTNSDSAIPWFASDFAIGIDRSIRQHPRVTADG